MWLLLALLAQVPEPQVVSAFPSFQIELPDGPAGRAWAAKMSVENTTRPTFEGVHGGKRSWREEEDWRKWADAVAAERASPGTDNLRRSLLASCAWSQGRSDDAWDHVAALAAAPEWLRVTVPFLFPGVFPPELLSGDVRNRLGALDGVNDGDVLAPALPPPSVPASELVLGTGRIERRAMKLTGLRIGAALVDMRVALEYEGLQIDLEHKSGADAKVKLRLPMPIDFDIANVYVDWQRREGPTTDDVEVTLVAGGEPTTIFARFEPLQVRWPTVLPSTLDATAREHGFALIVGDDDPERGRISGFATAMERLLGCKTQVVSPAQAPTAAPAISIDLSAGPDRDRKLRGLISQCERFVLARKKP